MTTNLRRAIGSSAALLMLTTIGLSAATSDVADAVMRRDAVALRALLARKADVNAPETARGTTAWMWAGTQRHPAAVRLLVDRGANVSAASDRAWQDRPVGYAKAVDPRPSRKRDNSKVYSQIGPRNMQPKNGG